MFSRSNSFRLTPDQLNNVNRNKWYQQQSIAYRLTWKVVNARFLCQLTTRVVSETRAESPHGDGKRPGLADRVRRHGRGCSVDGRSPRALPRRPSKWWIVAAATEDALQIEQKSFHQLAVCRIVFARREIFAHHAKMSSADAAKTCHRGARRSAFGGDVANQNTLRITVTNCSRQIQSAATSLSLDRISCSAALSPRAADWQFSQWTAWVRDANNSTPRELSVPANQKRNYPVTSFRWRAWHPCSWLRRCSFASSPQNCWPK